MATSSAVKDRYNKKAYDSIHLRIPKGCKEKIQSVLQEIGEKSLNNFIWKAILAQMKDAGYPIDTTKYGYLNRKS